jgi:hypothetical protein
MLKQWAAVVDDVTTIVCLDAAGQIREVDEPFDTLNGEFWHPPAHIHCRAIVVPWLPGFVDKQRRPANEELSRRPRKQRRKGPGGSTASNPPPDRSNPPGRKPPVPPVTAAASKQASASGADLRERDDSAGRSTESGEPRIPSNEGLKGEPGADVRRSDGMRSVLAGDAGDFRPDPAVGDPVAAEIARQRGADRLPQVVVALARAAGFVVTWSVAQKRRQSDILVRFTDHLAQFLRGPYRAGLGMFGAGIAFWVVAGDDEAELPQFGGERVEARLDPDARVIDLVELRRLQAEALARLDEEPRTAERERWRKVISDEGRYALLLGFDAIRVVHEGGRVELVELVVVNRGALIVEES